MYIVSAQDSEHLAAAVELHEEALLEVLGTTLAEVQGHQRTGSEPKWHRGPINKGTTHFLELRLRGSHIEQWTVVDVEAVPKMRRARHVALKNSVTWR